MLSEHCANCIGTLSFPILAETDGVCMSRYSKMRSSVTNSYIVNLAVSDFCFLVGLPFVIVTAVRREWIFGHVCCKLFYSLTSLNWFTSVCHHHHHFICPIIQQYAAHLHEYDSRRAGQQGPIRTLTAALKRSIKTVTGCIFCDCFY